MSIDYILRGARIIDPANGTDNVMDIGIANGKFADPLTLNNPEIINLKGKIITPGLIDIHVHLRDPGWNEKETIETGSKAAAAGGFTTIVAMPNTNPVTDSAEVIKSVQAKANKTGFVNVLSSAAITKDLEGKVLTDIVGLNKAGAVAVTDDGKCVQDCEIMLNALKQCKTLNISLMDHCEEKSLCKNVIIHDGEIAKTNGLIGTSKAAETIIVARDIELAKEADTGIHVQHVSIDESVGLIRDAQKRGINVTAEATPHHLTLSVDNIENLDTCYKVNPPIRTEKDRRALIKGLKDGIIDVIATDHAPHTNEEKSRDFDKAPCGMIGLETAIPLILTELYHKEKFTISEIISKLTVGPAKILGRDDIGIIKLGAQADLTVLDVDLEHTIDKSKFHSKSQNTPFDKWKVKGKAICTIVAGEIIYSEIKGVNGKIQKNKDFRIQIVESLK